MNGLREVLLSVDTLLMRAGNVAVQNGLFDFLMPLFDKGIYWGAPITLAVIGVLIWGGKKGRIAATGAVVTIILTDQISSSFIKQVVERIRPCNILPGLHLWWEGRWIWLPDPVVEIYKASYSFPSSHAANTAGQAIWWGLVYPKARWWGIGFALLVGYSRVYDGVHWPSDVIAGWAIGGGVGFVTFILIRRMVPNHLRRRIGLDPNSPSLSRSK